MNYKTLFKKILGYFLKGLIYTVPLVAIIYVLYSLFHYLDSLLPFEVPGLGLIVVIGFITSIGLLGSSFIATPIKNYLNSLLARLPLIKTIYDAIRDLLSAFVGEKKRFNKPVLVKVSADGALEKLGFITDENLNRLGLSDDKIAVYLPHSYNFSGNLFIVSRSRITPIDQSAAEVMKFIVSGGVTGSDESH
jgi:uncharacterized membrane protein